MPFAAAGAIAGVASAAVGVAGAVSQKGAAGKGAAQAQANEQQQRNDLGPWRDTGGLANTASADLLGLNGQDAANAAMGNFQASPGYQYQVQQGLRAVDAGAASRGYLRSGATIQAEEKLGSNLANLDFGNYYKNLLHLSDTGESAAAGGATTANTSAALAQGAGNTQASIYGDVSKGLQTGVNQLLGPQPGGGSVFGTISGQPADDAAFAAGGGSGDLSSFQAFGLGSKF